MIMINDDDTEPPLQCDQAPWPQVSRLRDQGDVGQPPEGLPPARTQLHNPQVMMMMILVIMMILIYILC